MDNTPVDLKLYDPIIDLIESVVQYSDGLRVILSIPEGTIFDLSQIQLFMKDVELTYVSYPRENKIKGIIFNKTLADYVFKLYMDRDAFLISIAEKQV